MLDETDKTYKRSFNVVTKSGRRYRAVLTWDTDGEPADVLFGDASFSFVRINSEDLIEISGALLKLEAIANGT